MFASNLEQSSLRALCLGIHEIHDRALILANYSGVWFGDKVPYRRRMPVIPASHPITIIQTLLHHGPFATRRHDETVEVNLKPVGDRIVVDARCESAGADQGVAIEAASISNQSQLGRCVSRELSATTAYVYAEFSRAWR